MWRNRLTVGCADETIRRKIILIVCRYPIQPAANVGSAIVSDIVETVGRFAFVEDDIFRRQIKVSPPALRRDLHAKEKLAVLASRPEFDLQAPASSSRWRSRSAEGILPIPRACLK